MCCKSHDLLFVQNFIFRQPLFAGDQTEGPGTELPPNKL